MAACAEEGSSKASDARLLLRHRLRTICLGEQSMRWPLRSLFVVLIILLISCEKSGKDLCTTFYQPYPDMVSGRFRTERNSLFLDAMGAYARRDYASAAEQLKIHVEQRREDDAARLYLCCAYLSTGRPYDAELQLDFIEQGGRPGFRDQVDWYNAMCMICSGQPDRAVEVADKILAAKVHTYKNEAQRLKEAFKGT